MVYTNVSRGWGVEGQRGIVRMRRWGAWLVLVVACCAPVCAQQMSVAEYQKKSAKAGAQQQKNLKKQAKQRAKAQKKAEKAQKKQLKQGQKADAKANRQLQH
jgi:hypothetical protein